ncbi:virulence factor Mce-like protein [Mycolicibacterium sp. BK556]|uniref:MCE family protein n=1 Tax=unclassified Mycolicibacterium TaxID=2636767 RepID=UPI00161E3A54|nr:MULTISPECIES: MCE family protein [unclassified Mycolicibacterium]MBB3600418.1 virulence factor Mce-like protein [Mycolicibacterium sp. BK556]MBB3630170.1 virulence factor Mce-like protein [Mycolicibacterium sp. BK607]
MRTSIARPAAGLATVSAIVAVIALAATLFNNGLTTTAPVTVMSERAGLVMNPDAKVKWHGVPVGTVSAIDLLPDGQAALRLAVDPAYLQQIPVNVGVNIASSTVFGAKYVELVAPSHPSVTAIQAGQVLHADHVTVEINTVFEQLSSVLAKIDPAKLNETLGAVAAAFDGRGEKLGQTVTDLNRLLAKLDPSLPHLEHELQVAPTVFTAYADAAPDLVTSAENATRISKTIVDTQKDLDAILVSATGLADVGNEVIGDNRQSLTDVMRLLVPTTDLLNKYHESLYCGIAGLVPFAKAPPLPPAAIVVNVNFTLGTERYRYPQDLPKVAATGSPMCKQLGLPVVPPGFRPPFLVTDIGTNRTRYGNQGLLLNADGLKQLLFGPIDGPPRNTAQIGQPG